MAKKRVIILGGGFAGVKCARTLLKSDLKDQLEVIVFNRQNHMVFHPLLAEIASAALQVQDVAAPLRQMLLGAICRTEDVLGVDYDARTIEYEAYNGSRATINYDYLVLACGNEANLALIPGVDEHAFGFKTIGDALALQGHIMEQLEKAEVCDNPHEKSAYLSFIVIGGGFSGVELAGEINELVRRSQRFYKNISEEEIRVTIIHSQDQILPEVGPRLREFAQHQMRKAGVTIILNKRAKRVSAAGVNCSEGFTIPAKTVVCTIGCAPHPVIQRLNVAKEKNRLVVEPDMSIPGYKDAFAIGDCANVINALDQQPCPTTAQFAERQGTACAKNIIAQIKGQKTHAFKYKMMGQLCSIGARNAVAEFNGMTMAGFPAWFMWRGIYLAKLPSFAQQCKVGMQWLIDIIFPRTLAHVKADRTKRLSRAFFAEGEYIFKQDDIANEFYSIEEGEVEVIKESEDSEEIVAVLGRGDFFGESALVGNTKRTASVRARTDCEMMVMGRGIFSEMAGSLTPLADAIAHAMKRRSSLASTLSKAASILDKFKLDVVLEPLPAETLTADDTVKQAIKIINEQRVDFIAIVDEDGRLQGIVTRSDLLRIIDVAHADTLRTNTSNNNNNPANSRINMLVRDIMVKDPVALTLNDSITTALVTMRDHNLKRLPVVISAHQRNLAGYVRIENIMDCFVRSSEDQDFFERRQRTGEIVKPRINSM